MRKNCIKRILSGLLAVIAAVVFFVPSHDTRAAGTPIDEIETYSITVSLNDDGSMNCNYLITWKVLDDQKEGPLTWVRVGVPSDAVGSVRATTDTVRKAKLVKDGRDTYIRVDLKDEYHAGQEVTFGFSCVIYNQFSGNVSEMKYSFTPGWFDDIAVDNYVIKWKADKVSSVEPARSATGGFRKSAAAALAFGWSGRLGLETGDDAETET